MSPLIESFGEEWVDMDDEEEARMKRREALAEAEVDNGVHSARRAMKKTEEDGSLVCKEASVGSSHGSGFRRNKKGSLFSFEFEEKEVIAFEVDEIVGEMVEESMGEGGNKLYLELEVLQEKAPSSGWAKSREGGAPMLKRVVSESSFMRGQVMVSRSESIQLVMSKRGSGKVVKPGAAFSEDSCSYGVRLTEEDDQMMEMMLIQRGGMEMNTQSKGRIEEVKAMEAIHTQPHNPMAYLPTAASGRSSCHSRKGSEVLHDKQGDEVGKQANGVHLEVKEVGCECCGMREECSIGYIERVKGVFSGYWVCGLCAEAVHEEKHRLGTGVPTEEAVRIHMNLCRQFRSRKKGGEPPNGIGVAAAVCNLLSRHLSDPPSPRPGSPARPKLSRTASCHPLFSHKINAAGTAA